MPGKRRKHIPLRSCIVCRERFPKRELIRIVRSPEGTIDIDPGGKRPGRGAYLCKKRQCWETALQPRLLSQALKCQVTAEETAALKALALAWIEESAVGSQTSPTHGVSAEG